MSHVGNADDKHENQKKQLFQTLRYIIIPLNDEQLYWIQHFILQTMIWYALITKDSNKLRNNFTPLFS